LKSFTGVIKKYLIYIGDVTLNSILFMEIPTSKTESSSAPIMFMYTSSSHKKTNSGILGGKIVGSVVQDLRGIPMFLRNL
jgi:hypothetical protein